MAIRLIRLFCLALLVTLSVALCSAQTNFSYSVTCNPTTLGPLNVDFLGVTTSGTVSLTPNVATTTAILEQGFNNKNNAVATVGSVSGTLSCSLTFGGVTVPFTRSLSLNMSLNSGGSTTNCTFPGHIGSCLHAGAASVTVNLGAQGSVTLNSPAIDNLGIDSGDGPSLVTVIPGAVDTATLLTPLALPGTPAPSSILLVLTGIAALAAYYFRRRTAQI